ncbi:DnaB-like helicase C-terminal domain-containing protein [Aestuariivirga sp.]|uniref:DnaB-like helicase C-terminal domain-containing protein n=1 Tax=Aestuariivirga sp. TaxID=2650926 RepID=UPI0039E38D46
MTLIAPPSDGFQDLSKRKLSAKTLRRYGYFLAEFVDANGVRHPSSHIYTMYDQAGEPVRQKVRMKDKTFAYTSGDAKPHDCKLFGHGVWGDKHDKRVVIFTGEIDAMSAAEATDFKFPCFSTIGGDQTAKKQLQANYRELDRYDEIVLYFDNDESGQAAALECASLFEVGKVKIAKVEGRKDASDLKQAGLPGNIMEAIFAATTWRPAGVVNAADCVADILDDDALKPVYSYKFPGLSDKMLGLYKGQVVYLAAGTGMGKTSLLFDMEIDWLKQGAKIGHLGFEDMRADVQIGLLSAWLGRRLILNPLPREERIIKHKELFGSRRVELFDPENAEWTMKAIFSYVRYMAKGLECDIVIVDPISFIAGLDDSPNKVEVLDRVAAKLSLLAKELGICLIIAHHLKRPEGDKGHEDGAQVHISQLRGSGGIANFASSIIGIEGDQQGDHATERYLRVLKNRKIGPTGLADTLDYDPSTGVFTVKPGQHKQVSGNNDY